MRCTCLLPVPVIGAHLSCTCDPSRQAGGLVDLSHFCVRAWGGVPHIPCSQKKLSTCCQPWLSRWPCHIGPQLIHRTQHRSLRHSRPACLPPPHLPLRWPVPQLGSTAQGQRCGVLLPPAGSFHMCRLMAKRKQNRREGQPPFLHSPLHRGPLGWWLLVEAATPR